jgi:hypothetical protein
LILDVIVHNGDDAEGDFCIHTGVVGGFIKTVGRLG